MYIILLLLLCLGPIVFRLLLRENNFKKEIIWYGFILFLYAAFRKYTVGIDVEGYVNSYLKFQNYNFLEVFTNNVNRDPLFRVFIKGLSCISPNPQFMLIVIGLLVSFSMCYFVKKMNVDPFFIIILFVCFRIYAFTLSGLRQAMSLSFVWIAMTFILEKKYFKFFLFVIIGSCFHISALVALIIPLLFNFKPIVNIIFSIVLLLIDFLLGHKLVSYLSGIIFDSRFDVYFELTTKTDISTTFFIYVLMILLILIYYISNKSINNNKWISIAFWAVTMCVIGQSIPNFFRIAYYYIVVLYVEFSKVLNSKKNDKVLLFIKIIFLVGLIFQYIVGGPGAGTDNYEFLWN